MTPKYAPFVRLKRLSITILSEKMEDTKYAARIAYVLLIESAMPCAALARPLFSPSQINQSTRLVIPVGKRNLTANLQKTLDRKTATEDDVDNAMQIKHLP